MMNRLLGVFEIFFILKTVVQECITDLLPYGLLISLWTFGFRQIFVYTDFSKILQE